MTVTPGSEATVCHHGGQGRDGEAPRSRTRGGKTASAHRRSPGRPGTPLGGLNLLLPWEDPRSRKPRSVAGALQNHAEGGEVLLFRVGL